MSRSASPAKALARMVKLESGEGLPVLFSLLYSFFLMAGYYVIRPVRDAMGASGSDSDLRTLYIGTLVGTLILSPVFSSLVSRFSRRVFVPWSYHLLALNLVGFYALFYTLPDPEARHRLGSVFFLWTSIFNLFAVSVFWGLMADLYSSDQARRLFGFIGLGGTLGAIVGAALTTTLAKALGAINLLLVAALLLECSVFSIYRLLATSGGSGSPTSATPPGRGALSGIRPVLESPYLLGICLFMFFFTITSSLLYFEQARIVRVSCPDSDSRTMVFGTIDLYVNILTIITQFFFSGRIITRLRVGACMAILPLVSMLAYGWLVLWPTLTALIAFQTLRRAVNYALVRPCREMLFTVLDRQQKYCAKNFIDTFIYRGGDAIGAYLDQLLKLLALSSTQMGLAMLPLTGAWIALALTLGGQQERRAQALTAKSAETPA